MAYGTLEGRIYWPMIGEVEWRCCIVYLFQMIAFVQNSVTPRWDSCILTARVSKDFGFYRIFDSRGIIAVRPIIVLVRRHKGNPCFRIVWKCPPGHHLQI